MLVRVCAAETEDGRARANAAGALANVALEPRAVAHLCAAPVVRCALALCAAGQESSAAASSATALLCTLSRQPAAQALLL